MEYSYANGLWLHDVAKNKQNIRLKTNKTSTKTTLNNSRSGNIV
jgi:hypothetical protein